MRRYMWLSLGVVVALGAAPAPAPPSVNAYGTGTAYDALGHMAVLHQGRVKPLDTMARQLIKEFYGSETITLYDSEYRPSAKWEHVGALLDMTVRPDFWDDQKIIRVEFLPLKRLLLAEPIKKELTAIAGKTSTSADDRAKLQALARASDVSAEQLTDLARSTQLPKEDGKALLALATRLGASKETKWFSPHELENTRVTIDGRTVPFELWLGDIARRVESEGGSMAQRPKLPDLEKNAYEAGVALRHYQAIRGDRAMMGEPTSLFVPGPSNATYLKFSGEVQKKIT